MIVEAPKSTKTETMLKAIGADANSTTNNMHNIISIPICVRHERTRERKESAKRAQRERKESAKRAQRERKESAKRAQREREWERE